MERERPHHPDPEYESEHALIERGYFIARALNLRLEDFEGKRVLDIGSGPSMVATMLRSEGSNASVASVEPSPKRTSKDNELTGRVRGVAQQLPIRSGSIDLAISFAAPPVNQRNQEVALSELNEIERVLSPNGEARIGPTNLRFVVEKILNEYIASNPGATADSFYEQCRHDLNRQGELIIRSTQFLIEQGFEVELCENFKPEDLLRHRFYWRITPRTAQAQFNAE